jgi:acyl-coenzyme A synthetase/AMP-(fatty) acid ligase
MFDRFIEFFAQLTPQELAISTLSGHVTYSEFDANIDRFVAALSEHDPPRPGLVAVCIADRYVHWLTLAALARLGVTSASYMAMQRGQSEPMLRPDLVITDEPAQPDDETRPRLVRVSPAWLAEVEARPAVKAARPHIDPDSLARIMTSSGTTGVPKRFGLSWRCVENRIMHAATIGMMKGARSLSLIGPEFYPYPAAFGDWARGITVLFGSNDPVELAHSLTKLRPSLLALAPIQLKAVLDSLPPGFRAMPDLTLGVSGSHTPRGLREQTRQRLAPNLLIVYMATEAGLMAVRPDTGESDDADVGRPSPWAEVEIVDDAGRRLPPGALGVIRLRSPDCTAGYIDDPEANARFFRDGWFYPGDVGALSSEGRLRVEGRLDEVMNFGGTKFMPQVIEAAVLACAGVRDAALFTLRDGAGFDMPWIAVVRDDTLVEKDIAEALMIPGLPPVHVVWTDTIPRSGLGKIQRDRLQAAAMRRDHQSGAS